MNEFCLIFASNLRIALQSVYSYNYYGLDAADFRLSLDPLISVETKTSQAALDYCWSRNYENFVFDSFKQ